MDEAIRRAQAYVEAGADVIFVEAPTNKDEMLKIVQSVRAPLLVNMVEGSRTPVLPGRELEAMGFKIVLYANTALRVAGKAVLDAMTVLKETSSTDGLLDNMLSWNERQNLVDLLGRGCEECVIVIGRIVHCIDAISEVCTRKLWCDCGVIDF